MANGAPSQAPSADVSLSAAADAPAAGPIQSVMPTEPAPEGFAAALLSQRLVPQTPSPQEVRLRTATGWRAPNSPLRLADRRV